MKLKNEKVCIYWLINIMFWIVYHTLAKVYWSRTFSSSAEKDVIRSRMSELRSSLFLWWKFSLNSLEICRNQLFHEYKLLSINSPGKQEKYTIHTERWEKQVPDWRPDMSISGIQFIWKFSFAIPNVTQNNQKFLVQISIYGGGCFSGTIYVTILDIIVFFVRSVLS
jgi:hypothetical protein